MVILKNSLVFQRAFINVASDYSRAQALASGVGALASVFAMAHRRFTPAITTNNIRIGRPKPTDSFW
jgi:hypothetical protein